MHFVKVSNDVATLSVETTLVVERTTPHAPSNVTVTKKVFVYLITIRRKYDSKAKIYIFVIFKARDFEKIS